MAKCVHCGERKGKRQCPALGGLIAASCCGQNRLRTIDCPPDCSWLGGLAAPAGEASSALTADQLRPALLAAIDEIDRFSLKPDADAYRKAATTLALAGEKRELAEAEAPLFLAILRQGVERDGETLLDRFLTRRGPALSSAQVRAVRQLARARPSLFVIAQVQDGEIAMRDALRQERVRVLEPDAARDARPGQVMLGQLVPVDDAFVLGPNCLCPAQHLDELRSFLEAALDAALADTPPAETDDDPRDGPTATAAVLAAGLRALRMLHRKEPLLPAGESDDDSASTDTSDDDSASTDTSDDESASTDTSDDVGDESASEETGDDEGDESEPTEAAAELRYEPTLGPSAAVWADASEEARLDAIQSAHDDSRSRHPPVDDPFRHAIQHLLVENALIAGEPAVDRTFRRLLRLRLSRHEAVHAVGEVLEARLVAAARKQPPPSPTAERSALARIDPRRYLETAD